MGSHDLIPAMGVTGDQQSAAQRAVTNLAIAAKSFGVAAAEFADSMRLIGAALTPAMKKTVEALKEAEQERIRQEAVERIAIGFDLPVALIQRKENSSG